MNWIEEVERELARGAEAERSRNEGKARTSARRAAGLAIAALEKRYPERTYGRDFLEQLRGFSFDPSIPVSAREAAERLQARLNPAFESPSKDPLEDARIIINVVGVLLR